MMKCQKLPDNFVVIDLETTGLLAAECAIVEVGAADAAGRAFYRRVAIGRDRRVDWPALQCNGLDALDLGAGVSVEDALCDLFMWLGGGAQRWIMGGKNPQFDYEFLGANWPKGAVGVAIGEVLSRRCLDLHTLAYSYGMELGINLAADDFNMDALYSQVFLAPEPMPHNALRGALHELEGFRRLLVDGADAPCKYFEEAMVLTERDWVQSVEADHIDNRRAARVEQLAMVAGGVR